MKCRLVALAWTVSASAAVVLASCSSFSAEPGAAPAEGGTEAANLEGSVSDGPLDASDGSAAMSCATRPDTPLICADFDESPMPLVHVSGVGSPVPTAPDRTLRAPGNSEPKAMWCDGTAAAVTELGARGTEQTTHVTVDLDVNVDEYSSDRPADGAALRVGVEPNQCYVDLVIKSDRVLLATHCVYTDDAADWYGFIELLNVQLTPKRWWHLSLDVDYARAQAVATLDHGVRRMTLDLNPSAKLGGTPFVRIGGIVGARIGFDNVVAVLPP